MVCLLMNGINIPAISIIRLVLAPLQTFCSLAATSVGCSTMAVAAAITGLLPPTLVPRSLVTWTSLRVTSVQPVAAIAGTDTQFAALLAPSQPTRSLITNAATIYSKHTLKQSVKKLMMS